MNLVFGCANALSMGLAPLFLTPLVGLRWNNLIGSAFFVLGPFCARYALDVSLNLTILTYGIVQGLGNMSLISSYVIPIK